MENQSQSKAEMQTQTQTKQTQTQTQISPSQTPQAPPPLQPATNPSLSAEEERKIMAKLFNSPLVKGESFFVVGRKWWNQWCEYSGFIENSNETGKADGPRPSQIQHDELFVSGSFKEMKKENSPSDYVLLHSSAWKEIYSWYGGGPPIERKVITIGLSQMEIIELFPAFLHIHIADPSTGDPISKQYVSYSVHVSLQDIINDFAPILEEKDAKEVKKAEGRAWIKQINNETKETKWNLVPQNDNIQKVETFQFPTDAELLLEYRRPDQTWVRGTSKKDWRNFEIGDIIDCLDTQKKWYESTVRDVKEKKVFIHYNAWTTRWDEWIDKNSDRLAPRNTHTTGPYMGQDTPSQLVRQNSIGAPPERGAVGLRNLGNTCFMNSTLQCLSNTPGLTEYFVEDRHLAQINRDNPLGWGGKIANEYAKLVKDIWSGRYRCVAPRDLKEVIGEFQPRFSGYQQHDSSELLSFLLDGLHEDLNLVKKKPPTTQVESNGRPDEEVAKESWERHLLRNKSIIVDMCQGQLKSRVVCPECKRESITFDPFMFLSVPLPEANDTIQSVTLLSATPGTLPKMYAVKCSKMGDVGEMREKLAKMSGTQSAHLLIMEVWNNRFYKMLPPEQPLMRIGQKDLIWVYELPTLADEHKESYFQVQLCHFLIKSNKISMLGVPCIVSLRQDKLKKYPNEELHQICKNAVASFIKGGRWEPNEEPPYELLIYDKAGKEAKAEVPKEGFSELPGKIGFSIGLHWKDTDRWYDGNLPCDQSITEGEGGMKKGIDLDDCMEAFTREEILRKSEAWYCNKCKKHLCATKKFDLYKVPDILIIHLKRFSYNSFLRDKISIFVDFPVEGLDMDKWIVNKKEEKSTLYDLYAVSNHYGGMGGGHYTAFGKNLLDGKWYNLDDSTVTLINNPNQVKTAAAYVLFYKRREKKEQRKT